MGLLGLFRRRPHERTGFALYGAAVAAARAPHFYAELGVPDTAAGRFELVSLHVGLLIRRLRSEGDATADALGQAVFDAMFGDMDVNLREMGIGDLSVGKRVKMLWEGFHGRVQSYAAALDAGDAAALATALERNIWVKEPEPPGSGASLAEYARAMATRLAGQEVAAMLRGEVSFA
ncbi:ubiquinol-cytochrome C chaperone family protein [Sediminicoccus sp. KRV36]|uniref:ubiquinol-cytochrome C chaperone family protein n=1 Tax=Sediminicoccus sp. KRV36 TaxID=3133721 RepID=UPI00200D0647|nr:ubiquinol-cytochrome C chaperone family protein [Sediminicoccus rosea]UPY37939.1 ubiquinol-cytochrome C chaperone [Sediminicoccus rosea]